MRNINNNNNHNDDSNHNNSNNNNNNHNDDSNHNNNNSSNDNHNNNNNNNNNDNNNNENEIVQLTINSLNSLRESRTSDCKVRMFTKDEQNLLDIIIQRYNDNHKSNSKNPIRYKWKDIARDYNREATNLYSKDNTLDLYHRDATSIKERIKYYKQKGKTNDN